MMVVVVVATKRNIDKLMGKTRAIIKQTHDYIEERRQKFEQIKENKHKYFI